MENRGKDPHSVRGSYTCDIYAGKHQLVADEPVPLGGDDLGPAPYQYLKAALGSCTAMTIRMYAERKKWPVTNVLVTLRPSRDANKLCLNATLSL